jgi:hypothetical protein
MLFQHPRTRPSRLLSLGLLGLGFVTRRGFEATCPSVLPQTVRLLPIDDRPRAGQKHVHPMGKTEPDPTVLAMPDLAPPVA